MADFDVEGRSLTTWLSTQPHYNVRQNLASFSTFRNRTLASSPRMSGAASVPNRVPMRKRYRCPCEPDVKRPVKWIEDRVENLQATTHSRAMTVDLEIGCDRDGALTALNAEIYSMSAPMFSPAG